MCNAKPCSLETHVLQSRGWTVSRAADREHVDVRAGDVAVDRAVSSAAITGKL